MIFAEQKRTFSVPACITFSVQTGTYPEVSKINVACE